VIALITGGSGCGKSTWAEGLAVRLGGRRYYLATMPVVDGECEARVARHQAQRAGKGFETIERAVDIGGAPVAPGATVLLECLPTLMANEMFGLAGGAPEEVLPYASGAGAVKLGFTGGAPEEVPPYAPGADAIKLGFTGGAPEEVLSYTPDADAVKLGFTGGAPEEVLPYASGAGAVKLGFTGGAPEGAAPCARGADAAEPGLAAGHPLDLKAPSESVSLSAQIALPGPESAATRVLSGVERLAETCQNLVIVTNDVFSDGLAYDPETRAYMRALSRVSRALAARADLVVEVVFSIPVVLKGELR
jgi:adenosyl cobinamide kinase/adenosyl cobinamide phosphate guanylyltransferase